MPIRDDYSKELELTSRLQQLTSAYEEISVMRIGRVRDQVLATRAFREGLFKVFSEVRASRQAEFEHILRRGKDATKEIRLPHRRRVAVLLSTDERFSGGIALLVILRFIESIESHSSDDAVIVGKVGRAYMEKSRPDISYTYFDLPEEGAPLSAHKELISFLRDYDDVTIFYGKFVNVVDQVATSTRLTSDDRLLYSTTSPTAPRKTRSYLFEPELPQIMDFFDTQIFAMLFRQTMSESALAQLGSRITAMESASANIEKRHKYLLAEKLRAQRELRSRKQRQLLAGMSLWRS